MAKFRDFAPGSPLPATWTDMLEELLTSYASSNFKLTLASATTISVPASDSLDNQVGLTIDGKWRYITSTVTASHPGGTAGTYNIWAVSGVDSFGADGSGNETLTSTPSFTLKIGAAPTGTGGEAYGRLVGTCVWSGTAITGITPLVGRELVDQVASVGSLRTLGTGANQAAAGNDGRLSDQRVPTDASVTNAKVASGAAIARSKLDFGSGLVAADLADLAVQTAKLNDAAVTLQKLASNSVDSSKIVDGSIGSTDIADLAVITQKLANLAVTTAKIADLNVTTAKLAQGAVLDDKFVQSAGTTFPASPINGQVFTYIANAASGILWHFRYNSGSASAYKWECIGGTSLGYENNGTRWDLNTPGSPGGEQNADSIVVPLIGDYEVDFSASITHTVAATQVTIKARSAPTAGASGGAAPGTPESQTAFVNIPSANGYMRVGRKGTILGHPAANQRVFLNVQAPSPAGTVSLHNRQLHVMPIRVQG